MATVKEVRADYNRKVSALMAEYEPVDCKPVAPVTGNVIGDERQQDNLRWFMAEHGWKDPRFYYRSQIKANGGRIRQGEKGIPVFQGNGWRYYPIFNYEQIEWEEGEAPAEYVKPTYEKKRKRKTEKVTATLPGGIVVELTLDQLKELASK
jgi:hypothetical protein